MAQKLKPWPNFHELVELYKRDDYQQTLKLRNITPTSVERVSLSLNNFFSGETTPDAIKFKIKGGSKSVGQPGLMGASSSSAHENVSRVEFEELKKSLFVVVSQQGIPMNSVDEMNKKLDILIEEDEDDKIEDDKGDEHHEDETNDDDDDDDDLDGAGIGAGQDEAHTGDVRNDEGVVVPEVVSRDDDTGKVDDAKKSNPVEPVAEIKQSEQSQGGEENIDVDQQLHLLLKLWRIWFDHWICGRLNIAERRIYLYNSLRSGRYMTAAKEACKPFSVILPYYFSMLDFKGLRNEAKFSTMEPFPIVAVDGLPEQVTASSAGLTRKNKGKGKGVRQAYTGACVEEELQK
ncbi:hypothetical protein F8388_024191 [Cannabis sativa]|uniref:Ubiquitin-like protease family profile domain-containing protein n=1 Tax=Cannabis sativa TaxID=3483 RepID=A0A7J6FKF0_CANSA|nr:hypothetical protein F8388_020835 [Cannabis sativa]KAF4375532.1 hypothetical protein F8388_024191 [Cannabis sativa]